MPDSKQLRDLELLTIRNIMNTEGGRNFMWNCLQNCNTYTNSFDADAHMHSHNSGKRSHGLWLERELREADFDLYIKMMKEHGDEN